MIVKELQKSDYRIRKLIGTLGLLLPFMVYFAKGEFLASISHYYYSTLSSLIFIIVLSAFGLFLLSYKGYVVADDETISDDWLTNIAGIMALVVVFVPTACYGSASTSIDVLCDKSLYPLFGHNNNTAKTIHLAAAGIFILCMGWMSRYKFTRGSDDGNHKLYKWCGTAVFISVALILICIVIEKWISDTFIIHDYYVYMFETTAVIPFGISWLVKGKAIEDVKNMSQRMFGAKTKIK